MLNATKNLSARRGAVESLRSRFPNKATGESDAVSKDIFQSWRRSAKLLKQTPQYAPFDNEYLSSHLWEESPLSKAAKIEQDNMIQMTKEAQLVVAITDPCGRILWTHSSNYMRSRAENLNFSIGGRWDEKSMGTNAVGLSLKLKQPATVFSCEHYSPFVQDWVCYAAPIIHPQSGNLLGILDMSTTWNKHTPLGQAAVSGLTRSIARCLPNSLPKAELEIHVLGQPRILFHGKAISLPLRQIEILCLLALNPEGLDLTRLHAALYGDAKVSTATLKAEISTLRNTLQGQIGSRPYRLEMVVWCDFLQIWESFNKDNINEAVSLYRGEFLEMSESPEIEE